MMSTMTTRQASYSENLDDAWLIQQTGADNILLIRKMSKYVHLRRQHAKSVIIQTDKYRLNYVEVEIGPPKRREGGDKLPVIKVSNNRVNYSTIVFPASSTPNKNDNKSDSIGTKSFPQVPPHQQGPLSSNATSTGKGGCHLPTRISNSVPGVMVGGGRTIMGNGSHAKLERKGSRLMEAQQQQQLEIPNSPPGSPPRRRALSTPTRSRKFPKEAEIVDTIKAQQEKTKEPSPPKTRTLPPREKLWDPETMEQDLQEDQVESTGRKTDTRRVQTQNTDMLSNSAPSYKLTQAMQAMQMKARRKSSSGDAYEVVNDPSGIVHAQQDQPPISPGVSETPPLSPEASSTLKCSPVMKRHRTELEKAFARRKLTGRISGEPEGYMPLSSSGESSPQEGVPSQFSDASSMGSKFTPVLPIIKSGRDRGMQENQKTASGEYRFVDPAQSHSNRKPIPAPRFGQQSRESSFENINDSVNLNQRPMPSPPSHQAASTMDVTATQHVIDDTYMNVAFCKPKQDCHRYENVFVDDRSVSLDRCSNASDSPRDSLEIHSNRPIPAPRLHGSNNNVQTSEQGSQHKGSSQHQQGKQHGHTRQGSYGSTAAILSHINTSSPMLPSSPNKIKSSAVQSCGSNALYAIPCKNGGSGSASSHGQTAMKANHNIAPEVPLSPKPEIPIHACTPRRDSHGSTGSFSNSHGCNVSDAEKSSSISKSISHLMKDGERREKKHKSHGEKKSREDRKGNGERKGRHGEKGDREKRGHGKRHRGDGSHGSPSSSKSKAERPSYGNQPWYYGRMLRQECEYLMLSQGQSCQYLVRDSSHRTGDLMLSVLYGQKVHHYVIQTTPNHKFHIAHHDFNMVEDILEFYHHHVIMYSPEREPVYLTEPFILKHK